MDRSIFLARVTGIYFLIVSISMLCNMSNFLANIDGLIHNSSIMLLAAFVAVIVGILMVVYHNVWRWHWSVLLTIIAWLILFKGACLLIYPQFLSFITIQIIGNVEVAYIMAACTFVLGLVLCYFGFRR